MPDEGMLNSAFDAAVSSYIKHHSESIASVEPVVSSVREECVPVVVERARAPLERADAAMRGAEAEVTSSKM